MKKKVNNLLILVILVLVVGILFVDESSFVSLYYNNNYEDVFVIKEVNTGKREEIITNNEVVVEQVSNAENSNVSSLVSLNNTNKWSWPTVGGYVITSYYSNSHKALDISAGYGSAIYAAGVGVVASVHGGCVAGNLSCNGRGGNYVVIKHNTNNYYTVYMHLLSINVSPGQSVISGQFIGTMGNTGNVIPVPSRSNPYAGTHLHFSLYVGEPYRGGYAINPMNLY